VNNTNTFLLHAISFIFLKKLLSSIKLPNKVKSADFPLNLLLKISLMLFSATVISILFLYSLKNPSSHLLATTPL